MHLVHVETEDGLLLHGSFAPGAATNVPRPAAVANVAFVLVHGTGDNFYKPGVLEVFAESTAALGISVWRINTRGHDGMSSIPGRRGSVLGGATYEVIDEARLDLAAWVRRVADDSRQRVVLVGHSMGAVKSIYFTAKENPSEVAAVVAISPPRFCHEAWMTHPKADAFRAAWKRAEELVAAGRPEELIPVSQPVPFVATAGGFLAKYGPHNDYDVIRWLPQMGCPTLVLIGTKSVATSPAFDGLPDAVREAAVHNRLIRVETIDGASTGYAGFEDVPFERAMGWFGSL